MVAVELLPEAQWRAPNARLPSGAGAVAGDAVEAAAEGEEEEAVQEVAEVFQVRAAVRTGLNTHVWLWAG